MRIGTTEIILIIVLALILFGGAKISGLGKALGKSIKDFRNEIKSDDTAAVAAPADDPETKKV
jgi:sec-independent protein translocase protein TatA